MKTNYRPLLLICIVLLASFFRVALIQYRQLHDLERAASLSDDNLMWTYLQLQNELYRLQNSLLKAESAKGNPSSIATLQFRYDTFISRIDLVLHGTDSNRLLNGVDSYEQLKRELPAFIIYADTILGPNITVNYEPIRFKQFELTLIRLQALVQKSVLDVNTVFSDFADERIETISKQIKTTNQIIFLQLILIISFIFLVWRQLHRSKQYNQELLLLTERLEASRLEAEAGNKAKSVFLANMSHEIRTPMNGVIGMISLLENSNLSHQQVEYLAVARDSAEHLLGLLNDVLDISKLDAERVKLDISVCSLPSLLKNTHRMIFSVANQKGLAFTLNLPPHLPEWVELDPIRVRQVIMNLLSNAIKFTEKGFIRIDVRSKMFRDGLYRIDIIVTDSGIGIDPSIFNRLFKRFSQLEISTTRIYGGFGLGLEISQSLAKLMKGKITLTSEVGKGSSFTFSFVTKKALQCDTPHNNKCINSACEHCIRQLNILLVDDSASHSELLSSLLMRNGHQLKIVSNARDAIESVQEKRIDLILMDVGIPPAREGLEAVAIIRNILNDRGEKSVIVGWSANAVVHTHDAYFHSGVDDYFVKPLTVEQLQTLLIKYFDALGSQCQINASHELDGITESISIAKQLLVVDDNPVNLMVVKAMLCKMGHEVDTAVSGEDACKKVQKKEYDIIFMDLHMPGMDGFETTRAIIRELGFTAPCIVALTADATMGIRKECLDAGMVDYCAKPLTMEQLNETVVRVLLQRSKK